MAPIAELQVVIVGAGVAGLATAISVAQGGHRAVVLEAAPELTEVGAGLQLTPNSTRLLQYWDLGDQILAVSAEPTVLAVHRFQGGEILAEDKEFDTKMRQRYHAPFLDIHRGDLQRLLVAKAKSLGVIFKLGTRVADVVRSKVGIEAVCESGERYLGDLVVGADGLWSKSREIMLGRKDQPLPTGDLAYRVILRLDETSDPAIRQLIMKPEVHFWIGPHAHAVGYSLKGGSMYNLVLLCPDDLPNGVSRLQGSADELREFFSGWAPILTRLLDHVSTVDKWKLMHREELETWTNPEKDFVLIGDSCHPMLPYLAQGANSSMEDGAVLGRLLSHAASRSDVPWAVKMFEILRKARSEKIVRETFLQRDAFHMPDGKQQEERDLVFASQLGEQITSEFPSRWTCPKVQPWLYGYDAYAEADAAARSQSRL